ncbi:hypothetical protein FVE85_5033 [Porphyridium purpureum]|uniref:Uncharacterized protein n=1 Tax=Porphyridium purpureum TaxID=35688 RepID=A0A5J4YGY6_PORPP|nr:hypothetical protein FVE85_5033 [Porphyridium purpureum]|eukprot:POR8281..scf237_24
MAGGVASVRVLRLGEARSTRTSAAAAAVAVTAPSKAYSAARQAGSLRESLFLLLLSPSLSSREAFLFPPRPGAGLRPDSTQRWSTHSAFDWFAELRLAKAFAVVRSACRIPKQAGCVNGSARGDTRLLDACDDSA